MRGRWELSDAQWELIEPILRPNDVPMGGVVRGKIRGQYSTGFVGLGYRATVAELPKKYPPYQTATAASSGGYGRQTGRDLACARGAIARARETELEEGFIDASSRGKKGPCGRPTKRGKGTKISPSALITVFSRRWYPKRFAARSQLSKKSRQSFSTNFPTTDWRRRLR